jgi:hypothetical protein
MSIGTFTNETLADTIAKGIRVKLEDLVLKELHNVAKPIVEKVAKDICHGVTGQLKNYQNLSTDQVIMTLYINNVKLDFNENPPGTWVKV